MTKLPSLKERALTLASEAWQWFKEGAPLCTKEQQASRLAACFTCPEFVLTEKHPGFCSVCGCPMVAKTWLATAACPDTPPRWNAIVMAKERHFFSTRPRVAALIRELESWRGTRFFRRAAPAIKGVRADCVSFAEAVMVNLGAIKPIDWPAYVTHYGGEPMLALLLKTLDAIPQLKQLAPSTLAIPGDLLACSAGKNLHHLAIYAGMNTLWHAMEKEGGISTANIHDPLFRKHLVAIYRAYE